MKRDNKGLVLNSDFPTWELSLLAMLLLTALGVGFRSSMKTFPDVSTSQLSSDPYDVRPERTQANSMNRVETGL